LSTYFAGFTSVGFPKQEFYKPDDIPGTKTKNNKTLKRFFELKTLLKLGFIY